MTLTLAVYWPKQLTYPIDRWPTPQRLEVASERERLFDAIIEHGDVTRACESLGMSRTSVYRRAWSDRDFKQSFDVVRELSAEMAVDRCNAWARDAASEVRLTETKLDRQAIVSAVRLQIDTAIRTAGKLLAKWADKPQTQVNVLNDNRKVIVTEEKRKELQERLARLQAQQK